ncbi:hypothetical protein BT93_D0419 [Corymbia citriodora subsp. variegata]|nr:hypothetical protein BT93_D0419 [Corymbia citriodora subsp. variegata]
METGIQESMEISGSPLFKRQISKIWFCFLPKAKPVDYGPGCAPVYLNVYEQTKSNAYVYWAGLGIFDSDVDVYGEEYAF